MHERVRFSAIQMSVIVEDKSATIAKAVALIDQAVKDFSPHIVALPELFATEYFPRWSAHPRFFAYAESIPGPTTDVLAGKAREHGIYLIAGVFERAARGLYYDSSAVIGPDGAIVGLSRKIELPNTYSKEQDALTNEEFYFASADSEHAYQVVRTKYGHVGQIICFNRHFPEMWRILAVNGADIIYVPVASEGKRAREMFVAEMRAMAYQQQCFVVVLNRVGPEGDAFMYGTSHMVNPRGELIVGPASDKEGELLHAEFALEEIDEAREALPFVKSFHSSTLRTLMAAKEFFKGQARSPLQFIA